MIRLALASDLHLEFADAPSCPLAGLDSVADILVAPGDIAIGTEALDWCATSSVPVIFVPGNHEFYGQNTVQMRAALADYASQFPHVHLLDPGVVEFQIHAIWVRVIGATLWTDFALFGLQLQESCMETAARQMSDHRVIRHGNRRWSPGDALAEFTKAKAFLAVELAKPYAGLTIVATHHAPSRKLVPPRFEADLLSAAFASSLDDLVALADVWAYGHTHSNIELEIGGCRVISNQRGYRHENPGWKLRVYEFPV